LEIAGFTTILPDQNRVRKRISKAPAREMSYLPVITGLSESLGASSCMKWHLPHSISAASMSSRFGESA